MAGPVPELAERAEACAQRLLAADDVLLASHIDADGLTSAAVAATALERAGLPVEVVFEKQLDADAIASIAAAGCGTVLFTDFGSGQLDIIADHEAEGAFTPVVADHHQPADADTEYHLNPLLAGLDGGSELSGAGAAYVLARALEGDSGVDNRDLAALAVVGAVGDMQSGPEGLTGANAGIVEEGVAAGVLAEATNLSFYGKQTRPLPKLLEYASDVRIPGVSNDPRGALEFLESVERETGADLRDGDTWKRWVDLADEDRTAVASALVRRAIERGVPARKVDTIVGTSYTLTDEPEGTELRDASEFSTLLNATARYERADVGLAVCLGDRDAAIDRARQLLREHRRNLSEGVQWVREEGVTREAYIQWFDAGDRIRETIVGIVAGIAVGADGIDRGVPIVAFARKSMDGAENGDAPESGDAVDADDEPEVKVSARGTPALVRRGLDLSVVMREASRSVGGDGGGHDVAAGATIPGGTETAFVERADEIVGEQLS
jgi:RecJ-like exonuclease